jgi:membrane-bound lytic murein transglycosylase D
LIVKNEVAINTAQASVDSFKKKVMLRFPQNQESIITLKGDSLYSIAKKHPGITISDIKSGTIFEMKKSNPE